MADNTYATHPRVLASARTSVAAQIILALITSAAVFVPLKEQDGVVNEIGLLELGSQTVELIFYLIVTFWVRAIYTWTRYLDWVLSTPLMLLSLMAFFRHLGTEERTHLSDLFDEPLLASTLFVLGFNMLMLVFGFLNEIRWMATVPSVGLGFVAFAASFGIMYVQHVQDGPLGGMLLWLFTYITWGLYGVFATLSPVPRNVGYNLIDLVSKNIFGLIITVYALAIMGSSEAGSGEAASGSGSA